VADERGEKSAAAQGGGHLRKIIPRSATSRKKASASVSSKPSAMSRQLELDDAFGEYSRAQVLPRHRLKLWTHFIAHNPAERTSRQGHRQRHAAGAGAASRINRPGRTASFIRI